MSMASYVKTGSDMIIACAVHAFARIFLTQKSTVPFPCLKFHHAVESWKCETPAKS